jgi:hypothetical protein
LASVAPPESPAARIRAASPEVGNLGIARPPRKSKKRMGKMRRKVKYFRNFASFFSAKTFPRC